MYNLLFNTCSTWIENVLADFDSFLLDHAAAEKKASSMAMSMVAHYPDKPELVFAMVDLAVEELNHYREVTKFIYGRYLQFISDKKDPYVIQLRSHIRRRPQEYLLDRLLIGGIIEARGHERFGLIADALEPGHLKKFYQTITKSESRHFDLFFDLATRYEIEEKVTHRLNELISIEADIISNLPIRAQLH